MRKAPTTSQLDEFLAVHMAALPDSISRRKSALETLLYLLPRSYAGREIVAESLRTLRLHEQAQARFQFTQGKAKP